MTLQSLCAQEPFFSQSLDADGMRQRMIDGKLIRLAGHLVSEMGIKATPLKARLILVAWLIHKHPEEVDHDQVVLCAASRLAQQVQIVREGGSAEAECFEHFSKLFMEWQARDKRALKAQLQDQVQTVQNLQDLTVSAPEWKAPAEGHLQQLRTALHSLDSNGPNPLYQLKPSAEVTLLHDYYLDGDDMFKDPEFMPFELRDPAQWREFVDLCCTQLCSLLNGSHKEQIEESLSMPIDSEAMFRDRLQTIHHHMALLCAPVRDQQMQSLENEPDSILWMLRCMNQDQQTFHLRLLKPHLREILIDLERKQWRGQQLSAYTRRLLQQNPAEVWTRLLMHPDDIDGFQPVTLDAPRLQLLANEIRHALRLAWLASRYRLEEEKVQRVAILLHDGADKANLAAEIGTTQLPLESDALYKLMHERIATFCREQLSGKDSKLNLACKRAEEKALASIHKLKQVFKHHVEVYGSLYQQFTK